MPNGSSEVATRIVDAHRPLGGLAFGYGQGSVLTGFTTDSDLDIVLVWDREEVPPSGERPAGALCDVGHASRQHSLPGLAVDNLRVDGWPVDVAHFPLRTFRSWCRQVRDGGGWREHEWPLPLHAVAGFVHGPDLGDPHGLAAVARTELAVLPAPLAAATRAALAEARDAYGPDLGAAADAGHGWLFHSLLTPLMQTAYFAWFAAEGRYCPFPKHLWAWTERFGLDRDITALDEQLWGANGLPERHRLALALVDRVLALPAG